MPNWKKVIVSGSDALLNEITSSGGIKSTDVTIDDWGSVSASLSSIYSDASNLSLQDVTDNGSTTTNDINVVGSITGSALQLGNLGAANEILIVGANTEVTSSDLLSIDIANQRLGIGTSTPEVKLDIVGESSGEAQVRVAQHDNTSDGPDIRFFKSHGTAASPTVIANGDYIGAVNAFVYDGSSYLQSGFFGFQADGIDGDTTFGLRTRVDGTLADRIAINAVGDVNIAENLTVTGDITGSDITIDDWGSVSASLASLDASIYGDSDVTDHINSLDVHSGSHLGTADTDDLSEGSTNLYYTDARVKTKLNTEGVISGSSQVIIGDTTGYTSFSSSIAGDITSVSNSAITKTAASGSRITVWDDTNRIRGYDSLHYFDNSGNDIGIRLNPSSVTGRTIRTGQGGGTTGVQILITRTPNKTYGATIDYVIFNSLTNRTAFRVGREISAWDNSGGNITGTGYTSFTYGALPPDIEVAVIESSGEMFLQMTWSGGGTFYISANIDTFGAGI